MKRLSRLIKPVALFSVRVPLTQYASAVTYKSFRYFDRLIEKKVHGISQRALSDLQRHFPDFDPLSKVK